MLTRSRSLVVAAWMTLLSQIIIVGTGGAVRLTGSGLGCSEWPNCTPESFTPVPEQGIHGLIEFGNRVWGGIVVVVAVVMLVLAIRRRAGRLVVTLAALVLGLTVAQALIGAVVVWMQLRPDTVGVHFLLSVVLVALSAVLAWKVVVGPSGPRTAPRWQSILVHAMTLALAVVVVVGVLTTGSGPHAGDGGAARNGLDPAIMQHVHAVPGYVLLALVLAVVVAAAARGPRLHLRWSLALLGIVLVQILVGIVQSNTGLPILLVGIHMVLSVVTTAIGAAVVLSLRPAQRVGAGTDASGAAPRARRGANAVAAG
ncbi:COX15/CtaA family protein [Agrococcus carbonis]|uniref:Cytochrome c oxidase assembly protein subunit 15 n=1 Tax=Agrococcus carbonis TaxID=684552 RepID=A0A1H1KVR7_9MICO|nr:COX15/CtaA family protein [Agrococcus carbonis]SDR66336.1 cytochrome c oxidase assembly protein subunit 15 [Agrococcus carbonis]